VPLPEAGAPAIINCKPLLRTISAILAQTRTAAPNETHTNLGRYISDQEWFLTYMHPAAAAAAATAAGAAAPVHQRQQKHAASAEITTLKQLLLTACVHDHGDTRASDSTLLYMSTAVAAVQALLRRLRSCLWPPHILQHVGAGSSALPCALTP
jgi:hypothetical protein